MPPIPDVQLEGVKKAFGRQLALRGVTCTLRAGRIALIMGPNGAGKSTLLTILSTLSRPTSGQVRFGALDHRIAERELRGRIGLLAHAPLLYRQLSSRENLLFFARLYRVPAAETAVTGWLARVGMAEAADRPVEQLSRGMVQRVALARALLPDPDLLLLDEPFTGLDRTAVELLRRELGLLAAAGKVIALVTHDTEAVDGLGQHLIVLRQGRVVAEEEAPALPAARLREHLRAAS